MQTRVAVMRSNVKVAGGTSRGVLFVLKLRLAHFLFVVVVHIEQLHIQGFGVFGELRISHVNQFMVAGKCLLIERLQLLLVAMVKLI